MIESLFLLSLISPYSVLNGFPVAIPSDSRSCLETLFKRPFGISNVAPPTGLSCKVIPSKS